MSNEHQKYSKVCMYPLILNLLRVLTHYLPPGLVFVLVLFFFWFPQYGPYIVENETGRLRKRSTLSLRY